ncbi:MAG: hypothetical protein KTR31_18825 [Myxococcales bacterium]|nr:hypothetical protein [Myxococcales bacterium]
MRPILLVLGAWACAPLPPPPEEPAPLQPLAVGEQRAIELHTFRFDVEDYELVLGIDDLRALPAEILAEVALLDLPLDGLVAGLLERIATTDPSTLDPAARNLQTLLLATPDSISLEGTSAASLEALSGSVGIPIAKPLADLFQIEVGDRLLPPEVLADAVTDGLVATHPSAAGGVLPITVQDLVSDFEGLAERFGPVATPEGDHPGVLAAVSGVRAATEDFGVALKASANALPYSGVDLTAASPGRVAGIAAQIDTLFDTTDPSWLRIEGLQPEPFIESVTVRLTQDPTTALPSPGRDNPLGSTAFGMAPWTLERMVAVAATEAASELQPATVAYQLGTGATVFSVELAEDRWTTFSTFADVGEPPPPAFLWDLVLEIAQVRLNEGLAAPSDIELRLSNVPLGFDAETLSELASAALAADPRALQPLAEIVTANGSGAPDLFYRPLATADGVEDWLFFVAPDDIPRPDGTPERPYAYGTVGFFSDAALTQKVSTTEEISGDTLREKVRVQVGDVLYAGDDEGAAFELQVTDKPSRNRLALAITRVQ